MKRSKLGKTKVAKDFSVQTVLYAKEYDVHGLCAKDTICRCDGWIKDAYEKGKNAIAVVHGHVGQLNYQKLNKLYDWLRNNELVESIFNPDWNTGMVYISVKKKMNNAMGTGTGNCADSRRDVSNAILYRPENRAQ